MTETLSSLTAPIRSEYKIGTILQEKFFLPNILIDWMGQTKTSISDILTNLQIDRKSYREINITLPQEFNLEQSLNFAEELITEMFLVDNRIVEAIIYKAENTQETCLKIYSTKKSVKVLKDKTIAFGNIIIDNTQAALTNFKNQILNITNKLRETSGLARTENVPFSFSSNQEEKLVKKDRNTSEFSQELEKIERKKLELIQNRKDQIVDIISQIGALTLDDSIIAGALLFLADKNNESHPILQQFRELAAKHKVRLPKGRRQDKK